MTHRLGALFCSLLFVTGCDPVPATSDGGESDGGRVLLLDASVDGGAVDAGARPDGSPAADAGPRAPDASIPVVGEFPLRDCGLTLSHNPGGGVTSVQVAGEFTGWGDAPIAMSDDDHDGTFTVTLNPSGSLQGGQLYAYKLIVDGEWILDPAASLRKYDGDCLNSGLRMPTCQDGPSIAASALSTSFDAGTGVGTASTDVQLHRAADGSALEVVDLRLNGVPLDPAVATLVTEAGTYQIRLSGLETGRHVLTLRATDEAGREASPVDLPFWVEEVPFEWRDSTMYMLLVDRFANGRTDNDAPVGGAVEYPADFHGGDLWGALEVLEQGYFENLGVNTIWLSPINQQAEGDFPGRDPSHRFAGYHGYWPSRAREVEPRFGGNEALSAFVAEAHRRGIRVLLDLINNQIHEDHEYFGAHPDWFRTACVCGTGGCGWSERPLDCLFAPYLPDINWRIQGAEDQFTADALYWVSEFGLDGFRVDAVKHVETNSIFNLRSALNERFEQGGARIFMVGETAVGQWDSVDYGCGETYENGYAWIDAYTGDDGLDGQFDFPTHHRLQDGLVSDSMPYWEVESAVADLENNYSPEGLHVRFLGTHDSNRVASRANHDSTSGCRWQSESGCSSMPAIPTDPNAFARLRRAFTILYTQPGIPFLYYGDEVAMAGGNDPDNRRDMLFTDGLSHLTMGDESGISSAQGELRDFFASLGQARQNSLALRRGRRIPLVTEEHLYVYAYAHDDAGELAIVAVNRGGDVSGRRMSLGASALSGVADFDSVLGQGSATVIGTEVSIDLAAGAAAIFLPR